MEAFGNGKTGGSPSAPQEEATVGGLIEFLSAHSSSRLSFRYQGNVVRRGYHVTEVKSANFSALDCGANPEAWTEIFVQLWDVDDAPEQMAAGKFVAILRKVTQHVDLDMQAKLTFEVSDGNQPIQLYRAGPPTLVDDAILVDLTPRPASCKPRDRWLEGQEMPCCPPSSGSGSRCCS